MSYFYADLEKIIRKIIRKKLIKGTIDPNSLKG